jgi:hypothetical protein
MARQSMPKALSSLQSDQRSYTSGLWVADKLKSWGVVGRLSGIVFGEEVRN